MARHYRYYFLSGNEDVRYDAGKVSIRPLKNTVAGGT